MFRRMLLISFLIGYAIGVTAQDGDKKEYSGLWGRDGEKWSPTSRLPDFSFAGYGFGERPIPDFTVTADVKKFGAKGDGKTDDTKAFIEAIKKTGKGAIFVPAGKYVITDIIEIDKSNIALRGAGPDKTILYFPKCLNDIKPMWTKNGGGRKCTRYSFSGGFISFRGSIGSNEMGKLGPAKRGDTNLTVTSGKPAVKGQRVQVVLTDPDSKSLTHYLYSGDTGNSAGIPKGRQQAMACIVIAVSGNKMTINRPLRWDIREEWKPQLCECDPSTSESGVEDLAVEFPKTEYRGEFSEMGYNAFDLRGIFDCWFKNIRIKNADSGLFLSGMQCTVMNLLIESERNEPGHSCGHHGIGLSHGTDDLVMNFELKAVYMHDIGLGSCSSGNAYVHGKGLNMAFDHHGGAPYENLFCDIDAGKGTRLWHSGGGKGVGKSSGARETFWNIRSDRGSGYPSGLGPWDMNFVGIGGGRSSKTKMEGIWFEAIDPAKLEPRSIYEAQLRHRLGGKR